MSKPKKPMTEAQIKRLKEELRVESVKRALGRPAKISLPRFSWDRDKDGGVQEQEANG